MNSNINAVLQNIVSTAAIAASEAKTAVRSAGKRVAEKYDAVKLNVELLRLTEEQENVFSDIGRMLFLLHTGAVTDTVMSDEGEKTPQQVIDALLVSAEQLQQEMDVIAGRLAVESDERICPECGRICGGHDVFCAVCGTRLAGDPAWDAGAVPPEQDTAETAPGRPETAAQDTENVPEAQPVNASSGTETPQDDSEAAPEPAAETAQEPAEAETGAAQEPPEA